MPAQLMYVHVLARLLTFALVVVAQVLSDGTVPLLTTVKVQRVPLVPLYRSGNEKGDG